MKGELSKREKFFVGAIVLWVAISVFGGIQAIRSGKIYESTIVKLRSDLSETKEALRVCLRKYKGCMEDQPRSADGEKRQLGDGKSTGRIKPIEQTTASAQQ